MLAYHNDPVLRDKYVARAKAHREADEIIQGYGYWSPDRDGVFRGCAIGCLAHANRQAHSVLETDAGLPVVLSRLADVIFEGMSSEACKTWPERYASAAIAGADLSLVRHRFCHWLLTEEASRHFDPNTDPEITEACQVVIDLLNGVQGGAIIELSSWEEAAEKLDELYQNGATETSRSMAWAAEEIANPGEGDIWAAELVADMSKSCEKTEAWGRMADKLEQLMRDAKTSI